MKTKIGQMNKPNPHFRDKVKIDLSQMHENLRDLARNYAEYAEPLAEAQVRKSRIARRIAVRKSIIYPRISVDPLKYGIEKLTDKNVEFAFEVDGDLRKMYKELDEAEQDISLFSAAVKGFQMQKNSLEKLVDLYLGNYWIRPKVPEDLIDKLEGDSLEQEHKRSLNDPESVTYKKLKGKIG